MASGAQLNRSGLYGGVIILDVPANVSKVAAPLTAYGTNVYTPGLMANNTSQGSGGIPFGPIGNDSGVTCATATAFSKWTFQMVGPGAQDNVNQITVSIYGTINPELLHHSYTQTGIDPSLTGNLTAIKAPDWCLLPGPSEQSGTGSIGNPLVSGQTNWLTVSLPLVAIRAVCTNVTGTPTGYVRILAMGIP